MHNNTFLKSKTLIVLALSQFFYISSWGSNSYASSTTTKANKPWTIFIFLDGDNNLEPAAIEDINEMERAVDTSKYNLIVELDRAGYDHSNDGWEDTRDFFVTPDPGTDKIIRSQCIDSIGEANMGDPNTLIDFVGRWIQDYPADNYMLILWDHGSGWLKKEPRPICKGVAYDETSDDEILIANGEYGYAIDSINTLLGKKLDILANDACIMGMQEVAYEVKDNACYIIFSECDIPYDGYPYDDILNWLNTNISVSPESLSKEVVDKYVASYNGGSQGTENITLSALKLDNGFLYLSHLIDTFAVELMKAGGKGNSNIYDAHIYSQSFDNFWIFSYDLYDFARLIKQDTVLPLVLRTYADSIMSAINLSVIKEGHFSSPASELEHSYGIAIHYPPDFALDTTYKSLDFASDLPNWWRFINGETIGVEEGLTVLNKPMFYIIPNPSSGHTNIKYSLPWAGNISLKLFDASGKAVKELYSGEQEPGEYTLKLDYKGLAGGIYFVTLKTNYCTESKKFIITK